MKNKTLDKILMKLVFTLLLSQGLMLAVSAIAQAQTMRTISGTIVTSRNEVVVGAEVVARSSSGEQRTASDAEGAFRLCVPSESLTLKVAGKNIAPKEVFVSAGENLLPLRIEIEYVIPPVHDSLVITAAQLDPGVDRRNGTVYRDTLFSRDDQVFHTLDAGINAGQHEGGGKSLEIRRFGFNTDHGGVGGGLKVLAHPASSRNSTWPSRRRAVCRRRSISTTAAASPARMRAASCSSRTARDFDDRFPSNGIVAELPAGFARRRPLPD